MSVKQKKSKEKILKVSGVPKGWKIIKIIARAYCVVKVSPYEAIFAYHTADNMLVDNLEAKIGKQRVLGETKTDPVKAVQGEFRTLVFASHPTKPMLWWFAVPCVRLK